MNTAAQTFAVAIAAVATAAAIGIGLADRSAPSATQVVKLERVVVVGKHVDTTITAKLPRVVIQARRALPAEVTVAAAGMADSPV